MHLTLSHGKLYSENLLFSHAQVNDARRNQSGSYEITARYSHEHERDLPYADGLGWICGDAQGAIVLGRVVDGHHQVLPCRLTETRLMGLLNTLEEQGKRCTLEIQHG